MKIYKERLTASNAENIISNYDVIADGSDNFETRFLVNDTCYFLRKTLVSAAILRFEGQISTFNFKNKLFSYVLIVYKSIFFTILISILIKQLFKSYV